jgi:hypothetical protein
MGQCFKEIGKDRDFGGEAPSKSPPVGETF